MAVLLVTYDLANRPQNDDELLGEIQESEWTRLSECTYAIETDETLDQLSRRLSPYLAKEDQIYITALHKPCWGHGPSNVNVWLERHLEQV